MWVSQEHALNGIKEGFIQVCHGKKSPLSRMKVGDYVTFYCPTLIFKGTDKYQKFLGVGVVKNSQVYQFAMSDNFNPFRMNIQYFDNSQFLKAEISPLIMQLDFIKNKQKWGYMFRFGHFEISKTDFLAIITKMGIKDMSLREA